MDDGRSRNCEKCVIEDVTFLKKATYQIEKMMVVPPLSDRHSRL